MAPAQHDDTPLPQRLALVIHALSGGGAERVLTRMANHWSARGVHVTLITLAARDTDVYHADASVDRVGLDVMRDSGGALTAIWNNLSRARALRTALRTARPDFVISFTDQMNVLTLLATVGLRLRVIICDRVDPRHHPLGRAWSILRRRLYRRCFAAVVQTASIRDFVQPLVRRRPVYIIPNAVGPDAGRAAPREDPETAVGSAPLRHLVAMGRLAPQKGFDLLITAFASIAERLPNWTLEIFGEGPAQEALREQIDQTDLGDRILLRGWTEDPRGALTAADLFVLSSRYEGFPNVLLDAMSCGLPVVSFDCPTGPAEIIRPGVDGLLVASEDAAALAEGLHQLMAEESLRREFGTRAADVTERFSEARFYTRWEAVFQGAAPDGVPFVAATGSESG